MFIQRISFFFSLCSLHGVILEFGLLQYLKLCSCFFNEQRQLLMCLHPLRNKRKHIMCPHPLTTTWQLIMRLHSVMNERQLIYFCSLKNYHVLVFGGFSLNTNCGRRSASPLTHTWLIESEVFPRLSHLVMLERVGEKDGLSHANSADYYRRPIASVSHFLSPQPGECIRVSYFLVIQYRNNPQQ